MSLPCQNCISSFSFDLFFQFIIKFINNWRQIQIWTNSFRTSKATYFLKSSCNNFLWSPWIHFWYLVTQQYCSSISVLTKPYLHSKEMCVCWRMLRCRADKKPIAPKKSPANDEVEDEVKHLRDPFVENWLTVNVLRGAKWVPPPVATTPGTRPLFGDQV